MNRPIFPLPPLHRPNQVLNLLLQLPNLQDSGVRLDIGPRRLDLLGPAVAVEIALSLHLLPLLDCILVQLVMRAVVPHVVCLLRLDPRRDEK